MDGIALSWENGFDRNLGGGGDKLVFDYTILAMAIVALSLILIVEVMRQKIDSLAHGKVFFENVLETFYRELSTLGIVEAAVFVMHKYYKDLNIQVERVFAEVHFTLFFVAIINAIMSIILYILTSRVAAGMWIQMESIDLDKYVMIRKEYDEVNTQLRESKRKRARIPTLPDSDNRSNDTPKAEDVDLWRNGLDYVKYPVLKMRHRQLLIKVRFHDLRLHFIESNNLPKKFRISGYLELGLQDVFKKLVHISTFAWIALLMFTNLVYFIMGIVASKTKSPEAVGETLSLIYLGYPILFIIASMGIFVKMKHIFFQIMKKKDWVNIEKTEATSFEIRRHKSSSNFGQSVRSFVQEEEEEHRNINQNDYFWGGDPNYIVGAAQFMQFGFAIAFAIMLVFNETIKVSPHWVAIILCPIVSFAFFMLLWCNIIPQYTQCTSLGQLVSRKHLIATKAEFELTEIRRRRLEMEAEMKRKNIEKEATCTHHEKDKEEGEMKRAQRKKSLSGSLIGLVFNNNKKKDEQDLGNSQRLSMISDLVTKPTGQLPVIRERPKRIRAASDGVASMRLNLFSTTSAAAEKKLSDAEYSTQLHGGFIKVRSEHEGEKTSSSPEERKARRKAARAKSKSVGVEQMRYDSSFVTKKEEKVESNLLSILHEMQSSSEVGSKDTNDSDSVSAGMPDDITQTESNDPMESTISFGIIFRNIFSSKRYRQTSAVFGTMAVFFMIAVRMELILIETCYLDDNENTWDFLEKTLAFWLVVCWLLIFICLSSLVIYLFQKEERGRHMVIAGVFDVILSSTCLGIFLVAEAKRCCSSDCDVMYSHRLLGDDKECIIACCTAFGTRLCGGVGSIEPFTSMIALRLGRFYIARGLCRFYDNCFYNDGNQKEEERNNDCVLPPTLHQKSSNKGNLVQRNGTSAELWVIALREFPEIVEKHGIFSTQILEVMLGVQQLSQSGDAEDEHIMKRELKTSNEESFRLDEKIENSVLHRRHNSLMSLMSDGIDFSAASDISGKDLQNFGTEELEYPSSVLIRRMRRCEIKLLQVSKKKWTLVDVVLTKHEIVWFDAKEMSLDGNDMNSRKKLFTSKGGKGLRLCDVAAGRIIVGRQLLQDIDEVKVKRMHSRLTTKTKDSRMKDVEAVNMTTSDWEFWHFCDEESTNTMPDSQSWADKWDQAREDRLKLHTVQHNTLYLRFLVDLHAERRRAQITDEKDQKLHETEGALLWCRTLVHLCGKSQLEKRQKLPHYGDSSPSRELLDLVEEKEKGDERGIRNTLITKGKDFISRGTNS